VSDVKLPSLSPVPAAPTVEQLLAAMAERDALIGALLQRIGDLEARVKQNSRNSSRPPSSDGYAKAKSPSRAEQKAAGRKPGKQPGATGKHLAQVPNPDEVREHVPAGCCGCGADLGDAPVVRTERRQVLDVPPGRMHVIEHQLQARRCGCGRATTAPAPAGVSAPTTRLGAATGVGAQQGQLVGGGEVQPPQRTGHRETGLVKVRDVGLDQGVPDLLGEGTGLDAGVGQDPDQETLGDADAVHLGQQRSGPGHGKVLDVQEVHRQRAQPRPVRGGRGIVMFASDSRLRVAPLIAALVTPALAR